MNRKRNKNDDIEEFVIEEFGDEALVLRVSDMNMFQVPTRVVHLIKLIMKYNGDINKAATHVSSNIKETSFKELTKELTHIWKELHSKETPTK